MSVTRSPIRSPIRSVIRSIIRSTDDGRPVITLQPIAQSIAVGATLTFTATASDAVSQQWYLDGGAISGATATTYTKTNAQVADDGNYYCRFTNAEGFRNTVTVAGTVTAASGSTLTFNGTNQSGTI